jgi:hypothetical protein
LPVQKLAGRLAGVIEEHRKPLLSGSFIQQTASFGVCWITGLDCQGLDKLREGEKCF